MTMRLQVAFKRPLTAAQRRDAVVVVGGLPKVRRVAMAPNGWECLVYADDLAAEDVRTALAEAGLEASAVRSSLPPELDAACRPADEPERVRAPGR